MKKRLFLLALPALMALSSCTYLASGNAQPKGNFFKEAADAQQEIFGGQEKALQVRAKAPNRSAAADMLEPVIGVQYRAQYNKGTELAPDYRIAVRFVAAIASLDVNAEWTRELFDASGAIDGTKATHTVTKAYSTLNSGGDPMTPATFAKDADYHYFVAYTLYDIPATGVGDYYLAVHLKLTDDAEGEGHPLAPVYSKAMAARIDGTYSVKFDHDASNYFMAGTINGDEDETLASVSPEGTDVARFEGNFKANDEFYICYKTSSTFKLYNSTCITEYTDNPFLKDNGNPNKKIKAYSQHSFAFNLDSSYHLVDIYSGYNLSYTNLSDSVVNVPLLYGGKDGTDHHQYKATISPKQASALTFTLDGNTINANVNKETNSNFASDLSIIFGCENHEIFLKEQAYNDWSIWMEHPSETPALYINGVLNAAPNIVPDGWTDKAIYDLEIQKDATVEIRFGHSTFIASASVPKTTYYRVWLHADGTTTCEDINNGYYLVGTIGNANKWSSKDHPLVKNLLNTSEYKLVEAVDLVGKDEGEINKDAVKVYNFDSNTWYPGSGPDCYIAQSNTYQVYFRPNYTGPEGWYYNCFYLAVVE